MPGPDEHSVERSKDPRRMECLLHREEMDTIQATITKTQVDQSKTSGKYTAMLWFLGIIGAALSILSIVILNKTSSIESLLSDNKVVLMQHSERIDGLRKEVDEIKARNTYIDQQQQRATDK